jgi:hypothetical protein
MSRTIKDTRTIREARRDRISKRRYIVKGFDWHYTNSLFYAHVLYHMIRLYSFYDVDVQIVDTEAKDVVVS